MLQTERLKQGQGKGRRFIGYAGQALFGTAEPLERLAHTRIGSTLNTHVLKIERLKKPIGFFKQVRIGFTIKRTRKGPLDETFRPILSVPAIEYCGRSIAGTDKIGRGIHQRPVQIKKESLRRMKR